MSRPPLYKLGPAPLKPNVTPDFDVGERVVTARANVLADPGFRQTQTPGEFFRVDNLYLGLLRNKG